MAALEPSAAAVERMALLLGASVRRISVMGGELRGDCARLARKISILSYLLDEITEFSRRAPHDGASSSSCSSSVAANGADGASAMEWLNELFRALETAKRLLSCAPHASPSDSDKEDSPADAQGSKFATQFKYVMWGLEKVLGNSPYDYFGISDEVQEQVELVQQQLRREMEKKGMLDENLFDDIHDFLLNVDKNRPPEQLGDPEAPDRGTSAEDHHELQKTVLMIVEISGMSESDAKVFTPDLISRLKRMNPGSNGSAKCTVEKAKRSDSLVIPEDFRCPISLELMRDPVFVSTGQTYERAFIQRWIDCGNRTCPKTQQKLQNLTLTPNYVLRSLIMQWCEQHGVEAPSRSKSEGSLLDISGERAAIETVVRNLSSSSADECRSAAAEIRLLAKKSTDNRILISEAGAIPALVNLLSSKDPKIQEHAVTALLNLSIYDRNKELIVLAGAILPIVQVLRMGSMEARENAAAAIFSLSLIDENKITIGSMPGAIDTLVDLLRSGSPRGRKDAATALFNLCIYQANKIRAVRAGILTPLVHMLQDSSGGTVDEALTILSILASHQECRAAIAKANTIPCLIDLLRSGQPRVKEHAAAILLALCKKDAENLACIGRLGALIPLTELTKTGTDRAKRKAACLLEHLNKVKVL